LSLRCFDELPGLIEGLLAEHERVALVYFDAFGWRFAEQHAEHPLLRRATVERWRAQFPSTTTAHTTTIHTGLPVAEHGLYEWHLYEPRLDRMITPLWFCFAGDRRRNTLLDAGLTPADVFPFESLYLQLGVPCHVAMPDGIGASPPSRCLLAGATVHSFGPPAEGLATLARALGREERVYGTIYLPAADGLMHAVGPDAPEVAPLIDATLTAIDEAPWPEGTLVLLTADHGMTAISPERTSYVNVVWPELPDHLVHGADGKPLAPGGSPRDLFLHVVPERLADVVDELGRRLEGKADVTATAGLFPDASDALLARLANLVVLPVAEEAAYWLEPGRFEQPFRGMHGGLSPDEMEIPLVSWVA